MDATKVVMTAAASVIVILSGSAAPAADGIGLLSPADAFFFLADTPSPGPADRIVQYGAPASDWLPLAGDWDGDETDTIGLYSLDRGLAGLRLENAAGPADVVVEAPARRLLPLVGDWKGEGVETLGWYDPASGRFTISVPFVGVFEFPFGPGGGHAPLAGDWNGDGKDTVGVYVDETDVLFLKNALEAGPADLGYELTPRLEGELVIAGDFDGDGIDTIARYDPATSTFFIHDVLATGEPSAAVPYGAPGAGWLPFAWKTPTDLEVLPPTDGFVWVPDVGVGAARVIVRSSFAPPTIVAVEAHRELPPRQSTLIATAQFGGFSFFGGRRAAWGFDRPGTAFGRNFYVVLFTDDGRTLAYLVPDGSIAHPPPE